MRSNGHLRLAQAGPIDGLSFVPSGEAGKRIAHPRSGFDMYFPARWERLALSRIRDARARTVDPDSLKLAVDADLTGRRIVVFDDTWATGASAQSVSVVLKRTGAAFVSIVVMGRWVNSGWTPTQRFFRDHPRVEWTGAVCPVSSAACS